jgi:hypothetical protein
MTPEALLASLRAGKGVDEAARKSLAHAAGPAAGAARAEVAPLLVASLRPADKPIARWLLEQEVLAHEAAGRGASETLYILIAALARYTDPDDVLLLWRAREATPETHVGVDVEQAARAGIDHVRRRLQTLIHTGGPRAQDAACALQWLDEGLAAVAASDLPGYFAWSDERFGLHVSGPT